MIEYKRKKDSRPGGAKSKGGRPMNEDAMRRSIDRWLKEADAKMISLVYHFLRGMKQPR